MREGGRRQRLGMEVLAALARPLAWAVPNAGWGG